jgi:AraC-like DNA-binding protein
MKNSLIADSIKYEELTGRFEITALPEEWTIVTVCKGSGNFQSKSYIHKFRLYDCFIIPSRDKLILVPESHTVCKVLSFSYSYNVLFSYKSNNSAFQMLNEFLDPSRPLTLFNISDEVFYMLENYAAILLEIQSDCLPHSILIYQYLMNSLLLILARTYSISQPPKKQSSKEVSSRLFIIENVKYFISQNYSDDVSLSNIADFVFTNPTYLSRIFKETTGIGLSAYINQVRITKAKQLLLDTNDLIIDIAVACGFNYIPHFNFTFKELEGMTPTQFRKAHKNKIY